MRQLIITQQITLRDERSVNRYFQDINKYQQITANEEVELAQRIKSGDKLALEKLVLANLRFVISVAKQYQNRGLSFSDLINEGNMGLVKAAQRFDETRGFKFISYAVWWIRQSIIQAISEKTRVVRLPLNRINMIQKVNRAHSKLEQYYEREPTTQELADYLEVNYSQVEIAHRNKTRQLSFDQPLASNDENSSTLYDKVNPSIIPSPDTKIVDESDRVILNKIINKLSVKEAQVLFMAFGLNGNQESSINQIASEMNMSAERIRQIKQGAIKKAKRLIIKYHPDFQLLRQEKLR